jgi:acetylornithine deacetylase
MPDRELARLSADLVAIESVNPDLGLGGAGEAAIAAHVAEWSSRAGLEVEIVEARPVRPSVIAAARGTGDGRTLLLNAHLDTVGLVGMEQPLEPRIDGDRLFGRGSYDMKAALAAILLVAAAAAREPLAGDVIVTAVADEEVGSIGTEAVLERVRADASVVVEPTELQVAVTHRGFWGFEIETKGVAAHGSRPDLGVDAIALMGPVLLRVAELDGRLRAAPTHPLLSSGSLHASLIEGGQEYSSYPARCLLTGERRTIPGESRAQVEAELSELAGAAELRMLMGREPFEVGADEEIVQLVRREAGTELVGVPFWTDAALVASAGIPTVLFGPAGEGAHAVVEWVDLPSVERVRDVLLAVARAFCSRPPDPALH